MRYMLQPHPTFDFGEDTDNNFKEALEVTVQYDRASPSLLQRRLGIGYARACRIMDQLEAARVVGPAEGSKPREVLIRSNEEFLAKNGQPPKNEHEDVFGVPENYKVPRGIKLSKTDNIPWGNQFSDAIEKPDFKDSKVDFPVHLGFDEEEKLYTESLLDVGNLIIAGNSLSQKENLVDTILLTSLLRYAPQNLRIILNDPTHYLDLYNVIPHLLSPVINEHSKVISAFKWSLGKWIED
jgi:DNA segregation ATPase FtsK/SpoIIIE-like protein